MCVGMFFSSLNIQMFKIWQVWDCGSDVPKEVFKEHFYVEIYAWCHVIKDINIRCMFSDS